MLITNQHCFYCSLNDELEKVLQPQAMPNEKLCIENVKLRHAVLQCGAAPPS